MESLTLGLRVFAEFPSDVDAIQRRLLTGLRDLRIINWRDREYRPLLLMGKVDRDLVASLPDALPYLGHLRRSQLEVMDAHELLAHLGTYCPYLEILYLGFVDLDLSDPCAKQVSPNLALEGIVSLPTQKLHGGLPDSLEEWRAGSTKD